VVFVDFFCGFQFAHVESVRVTVLISGNEVERLLGVPADSAGLVEQANFGQVRLGTDIVDEYATVKGCRQNQVLFDRVEPNFGDRVTSPGETLHGQRLLDVPKFNAVAPGDEISLVHGQVQTVHQMCAHKVFIGLCNGTMAEIRMTRTAGNQIWVGRILEFRHKIQHDIFFVARCQKISSVARHTQTFCGTFDPTFESNRFFRSIFGGIGPKAWLRRCRRLTKLAPDYYRF